MNDTLRSASRMHNHHFSRRCTLIMFSLIVVEYLEEEITWPEKETRKRKGGKHLKKKNIWLISSRAPSRLRISDFTQNF